MRWAEVIDSLVSCGTVMKSDFNMLSHNSGYEKSLRESFRPPRIAAAKIDYSCGDGTLAHSAHVRLNLLDHLTGDRRQPIKETEQPMPTHSPLGGTIKGPSGCRRGWLRTDATNLTKGELEVRSYVSDSIEINDDEEPIPQLEAGKAVTMVSKSVKLNNYQCEPVMYFKRSFGSVQYITW